MITLWYSDFIAAATRWATTQDPEAQRHLGRAEGYLVAICDLVKRQFGQRSKEYAEISRELAAVLDD